jgi:hypothetical protein
VVDQVNHRLDYGMPYDDALVQMLPFSEASGVRYRFGLRIIDTSRMANLNVGRVAPDPSSFLPNVNANSPGTFNGDYVLNQPGTVSNVDIGIFNRFQTLGLTADANTMARLNGTVGPNNTGRVGAWNYPTTVRFDYVWNQATYQFENRALGTTPFDLADELEFRSYGSLGTMAIPRAAVGYDVATQIWPNTLGNRDPRTANVQGNLNPNNFNKTYRENYTTYSYSRDLRAKADPVNTATGQTTAYIVFPSKNDPPTDPIAWIVAPTATQLVGGQPYARVWPSFPARVAALPDISVYTGYDMTKAARLLPRRLPLPRRILRPL